MRHSSPTSRQAIIVARVSSREQEEGYSIDAQIDRLRSYCKRKSLKVIKEFIIVESSTTGDRKKFLEMISFAKKQKVTTAIVADKIDRIQRSFKETPLLDDLVNRGKIELHFNVENCIIHQDSNSMQRLMWNLGVLMAQNYVDSLKDNVNRGIAQKLKSGEWVSHAPLGYVNRPDERGKPYIYLDEERAPLVKKLFESYATGSHTLQEIVEMSKKWGLTNKNGKTYLGKSNLHRILNNPFYYGVMRLKKDGAEYPHKYPAIIDKALFDRCQEVKKNWNKKRFKYGNIDFVFRGLIKCAITGKTVSCEKHKRTQQNGNKHEWTYLSAASPQNPQKKVWIREEVVLAELTKAIENIKIFDQALLTDVLDYLKQKKSQETELAKKQTLKLQKEQTELATKQDRLLDLLVDNLITKGEFDAKKKQYQDRKFEIEALLENLTPANDNLSKQLIKLANFSRSAAEKFKSSNNEQKRQLINCIFLNLSLKGKKLDYTMRTPFNELSKHANHQQWWDFVDKIRTSKELQNDLNHLLSKFPNMFD